jgi:hypothetical protein
LEPSTLDLERRQAVLACAEAGAHLPQGHGDAIDRPAADRLIAVQRPIAPLLPGEPARQQPQQRPRVADVDPRRRRPAQTHASNEKR